MAEEFFIKDASKYINQEVTVRGWVFNKRSSGSIIFLQVRDGTGFIQATVVKDEADEETFAKAGQLNLEASVIISGQIKKDERAPGGFEMTIKALSLVSDSIDFPIGKKEHGPDFLLSNRHLWLRSKRQWAILRIRNVIINSVNEYLQKENFIRIDSPLITPSACEGTMNLFSIDYFGEKAYLSQSGQLYLEAAIFSFGRCYDFGPVLRAEKSKTRRHLVEFWMMDAEAAFMEFSQMLEVEENLIYFVIQKTLEKCRPEFKILERDLTFLENIKLPFVRLHYREAIEKLKALGSDIVFGTDLGNDDETILMNHYRQPVFVTHYPAAIKAFYAKKDSIDKDLALSADLLAPEGYGEIIGGGEREDSYEKLLENIKNRGYNAKDYEWYLDLRRYGSIPHSGFGLGLERLVAWLCKLDHVRESIPFPRMLQRFYP